MKHTNWHQGLAGHLIGWAAKENFKLISVVDLRHHRFGTVSDTEKSKIKVPADSGPGEGALPGWQPADSLLCPHKGAVGSGLYGGSPDKDTNPIGLGLHLYGLTELLIISFDFF